MWRALIPDTRDDIEDWRCSRIFPRVDFSSKMLVLNNKQTKPSLLRKLRQLITSPSSTCKSENSISTFIFLSFVHGLSLHLYGGAEIKLSPWRRCIANARTTPPLTMARARRSVAKSAVAKGLCCSE